MVALLYVTMRKMQSDGGQEPTSSGRSRSRTETGPSATVRSEEHRVLVRCLCLGGTLYLQKDPQKNGEKMMSHMRQGGRRSSLSLQWAL